MFLTRLVYTSSVTDNFSPNDIENILEIARKNNQANNVTGMLCFNRKFFLQCLEGSRSKVNETYHSILNDNRHQRIIMLDYKEISARNFSEWSMGYMPESSLTSPVNIKFSGTPEFNPYEMSGESAHLMMLALKETIPSI
ncbi:BLUF domain-containing protein [Maricurvus nonylphenolicus]|uniref:BLUF domain-containing protein n=1 Tax=Maricurvus nonylphenolicus TaxID=1008307 RepID=UPI0036F1C434